MHTQLCVSGAPLKMDRAQTRVQSQTEYLGQRSEFRTAVFLHSHTYHSKEPAAFVPLFIQHIPILSQLVPCAMKRYEDRTGTAVDFRRIYWTPPVSPSIVLATEISQIEE